MRVAGAAALVTGGASGLGLATVRRLHAAGAAVAVVDRNRAAGEAVVAELGERTRFVEADVTDAHDVESAVAAATEAGPLRVAVSCAGVGWAQRTVDRQNRPADLDPFAFVVRVNLVGTFNLLRVAAAAMAATEPLEDGERGVVVNTASAAAFDGQIGQVAYAASKGGIVAMTLPAARDLSVVGVRVVTVAPGTFDTPLMQSATDETRAALGAAVPFPRRMGRPDEFAALVLHIVENPYLNGETIRLDGAIRMAPR